MEVSLLPAEIATRSSMPISWEMRVCRGTERSLRLPPPGRQPAIGGPVTALVRTFACL